VSLTVQAYRVASFIETTHAKDRAALLSRGRAKFDWRDQYDPLAATCLAELLISTFDQDAEERPV
jgi:hypothetical protein